MRNLRVLAGAGDGERKRRCVEPLLWAKVVHYLTQSSEQYVKGEPEAQRG